MTCIRVCVLLYVCSAVYETRTYGAMRGAGGNSPHLLYCCYLLKPENIFYLCIIMKNVLFCILMIYVVCGCRSQQPQEIVRLAVKSLDELQSVSAVLVSNAAFDGAELSDELASRIPFLFKQVVRDSGTYFFYLRTNR